jgi:hypothetical protein
LYIVGFDAISHSANVHFVFLYWVSKPDEYITIKGYIMFKPVWKTEFVFIFVVSVVGCASVGNEKQCRAGNWMQIGFNDGIYGRALENFNAYETACAQYEYTNIDRAQYHQGWSTGNEIYCKPEHGYVIGLRGGQYNGVCTSTSGQKFLDNYINGYGTFLLTTKLVGIETALDNVNRDLHLHMSQQSHNYLQLLYRIKAIEQKLKSGTSTN